MRETRARRTRCGSGGVSAKIFARLQNDYVVVVSKNNVETRRGAPSPDGRDRDAQRTRDDTAPDPRKPDANGRDRGDRLSSRQTDDRVTFGLNALQIKVTF